MKHISKQLFYDENFFQGKLPENSQYLPNPKYKYPFYIKENLIPPEDCDALAHNALTNGNKKLATVGTDNSIIKNVRNTYFLLPDPEFRSMYMNAVNSVKSEVEEYFGMQLGETGETQTYGYPPGGHYILHADDSVRQYNDAGEITHWKTTNPNRNLSTILYFTDSVDEITGKNQCVGGNLEFEYLKDKYSESFLLEPKKGMYIVFPSNPYFSHRVHEVYEGQRIAIVNWYKRIK